VTSLQVSGACGVDFAVTGTQSSRRNRQRARAKPQWLTRPPGRSRDEIGLAAG